MRLRSVVLGLAKEIVMFNWLISFLVTRRSFPGKSRLLSLIPSIPYRNSRTAYGVRMCNNVKDSTYWFALTGAYGKFLENQIRGESDNFVFLDIGANQGLFSLIASENPLCSKVFAFEPNPYVFSLLVENINLNRAKVDPICAAITSGPARMLSMMWPPGHSGMGSIDRHVATSDTSSWKQVCIAGVNHLIIDSLPIFDDDVLLVKIDVEGHEALVLGELFASRLGPKISTILLEVSENSGGIEHVQLLQSLLSREGFQLTKKDGTARHFDAVFKRPRCG